VRELVIYYLSPIHRSIYLSVYLYLSVFVSISVCIDRQLRCTAPAGVGARSGLRVNPAQLSIYYLFPIHLSIYLSVSVSVSFCTYIDRQLRCAAPASAGAAPAATHRYGNRCETPNLPYTHLRTYLTIYLSICICICLYIYRSPASLHCSRWRRRDSRSHSPLCQQVRYTHLSSLYLSFYLYLYIYLYIHIYCQIRISAPTGAGSAPTATHCHANR